MPRGVENRVTRLAINGDKVAVTKLLQRAIDVHGGEPQGLAKVRAWVTALAQKLIKLTKTSPTACVDGPACSHRKCNRCAPPACRLTHVCDQWSSLDVDLAGRSTPTRSGPPERAG